MGVVRGSEGEKRMHAYAAIVAKHACAGSCMHGANLGPKGGVMVMW